ncbi:MAG TPA: SLC13 family permease [Hyphomicrobiaceae bacterium]|nr:SLC13 family permease [Hyphomicrobiaceae bacterium]
MTPEILTCLLILAAAIALFAWDRIPADVVALGVLLAVVATRLLPPDKAFAGFASDTVMMILGLLIMTAGLIQTGIVDVVGRYIFEVAGRNAATFLPIIMVAVASISAFMSNTAATALFVPLVVGYASKIGKSPSKFLLPLAFASILASSVTLISSSTNLIVSDFLTRYEQGPMGMFELAPVGVPIAIAGLVYMMVLGTRLIPVRTNQKAEEKIGERNYQADVIIEDGPLLEKTLKEAALTKDAGLEVVKVLRGEETLRGEKKLSELTLQKDDELIIEGLRADLLKIKGRKGLSFKADVQLLDEKEEDNDETEEKGEDTIVEGVVLPRSPLIGQSLRSLAFKERYGLSVLALHRAGRVPKTISSARLRLGDVLLLQGKPEDVKALERGNLFNIFGGVEAAQLNPSRAPIAAGIFLLAIAAVTFNLVSLPVAMIGGAFLMLLTRCLSPEQAYAQVEWKALILIGALLSLGAAMEASGAGKFLAAQLIGLVGSQGPYRLLTCFFVLTVLLTQPMSNQAAALVVLPIAMETGIALGGSPRPFAMMVAVAASCSYLTPLEPSCLLVYGPGKYQFSDFFKVGLPLTVLIYVIAIVLVPWVWPI